MSGKTECQRCGTSWEAHDSPCETYMEMAALEEVAEKAREVADWQCDHNAGHEDQQWYPPGPPCEDCKQLRAALARLDEVRKEMP